MTRRIILASGSPRRRELLSHIGLEIDVRPPDIDETPLAREAPRAYVLRLALAKAAVIAQVAGEGAVVVAADTTVECDGVILGKPDDPADAIRMLTMLRGRAHNTHTGVAVRRDARVESTVVSTSVEIDQLSDKDIDWYVGTGEPLDKAGAYAIQGRAAAFVRAVHGSVTNVVGLPLAETLVMLRAVGIETW